MRVIKDNTKEETSFPVKATCGWCGSELEVDEKDCTVGAFGIYHFICPCCNKSGSIDREIRLTTDNLEFPTHFFHFNYEETYPSSEEIKEKIKELIDSLRTTGDHSIFSAGRSLYAIEKMPEDHVYSVSVAPNYYNTEIPFGPEDTDE